MQNDALCNRYVFAFILGKGTHRLLTTTTEGGSGYTAKDLRVVAKIMRVMQLTAVLLTVCCLSVTARTISQTVTYTGKDVRLETVFNVIEKQTGYFVLFEKGLASDGISVNVDAKNMPLKDFLEEILKGQPFTYSLKKTTITIARKMSAPDLSHVLNFPPPITVRGRIVNEKGEPVSATILIEGTKIGTVTDADGNFSLNNVDENASLIVSGINIETYEVPVNKRSTINITVNTKISSEDEVVINAGYYKVENKKRTANIARVDAKDIERQPVTSPLMALQGRVAGVEINPSSGVPGSMTKIVIRGQNSLRQGFNFENSINGNLPLYIIDGVPVDPRPVDPAAISFVDKGFDPLSSINPANIQSIEILKDADATAIYGSRGANGVVLITTRQGNRSNRTGIEASFYKGAGEAANHVDMLTTKQYVAMRKEAYQNANQVISGSRGRDLLVWDTTRYTDWQKELIGGTSQITDVQASVTGGNNTTSFRAGGSLHKETLIIPGDFGYARGGAHFNLQHASQNERFRMGISMNYGLEHNQLSSDYSYLGFIFTLSPNAPALYDSAGNLNWQNSTWSNPIAGLRNTDDLRSTNLMLNSVLSYKLFKGITIKANIGYTDYNSTEINKNPINSYDPNFAQYYTGIAGHAANKRKTWIVEPQVNYDLRKGNHKLNLIVGGSAQKTNYFSQLITASGYTSDALLGNLQIAPDKFIDRNINSQYKYIAAFGRIGYDYAGKYFVNFTGRRDGSTRFGPGRRFADFGAVGAAWIFSEENVVRKALPFLSFGKIRGSYGTSGNDQIGDYKYYNTYTPQTSGAYLGTVNLIPTSLFNPDYAWEVTRKLELAFEAGFLKNRIWFELSWYRNRSSNQLVGYPLPATTGFPNILSNLNAVIQNTGLEFLLRTENVVTKNWKWSTSLNFSVPRNKLVSFPGIEESPYNFIYKVGEPLNIVRYYHYAGIDQTTGMYTFKDENNDGIISSDEDALQIINYSREYYGGLNNTISYKNFELSFLFQFSKQSAQYPFVGMPGSLNNQPAYVLDHWQKAGDNAAVQRYSLDNFGKYRAAYNNFRNSDGSVQNASFVRLKTLSFTWQLPGKWIRNISAQQARIFLQGQNLFTKTNYIGLDPETYMGLPPLRMLTAGFMLNF